MTKLERYKQILGNCVNEAVLPLNEQYLINKEKADELAIKLFGIVTDNLIDSLFFDDDNEVGVNEIADALDFYFNILDSYANKDLTDKWIEKCNEKVSNLEESFKKTKEFCKEVIEPAENKIYALLVHEKVSIYKIMCVFDDIIEDCITRGISQENTVGICEQFKDSVMEKNEDFANIMNFALENGCCEEDCNLYYSNGEFYVL